MAKRKLSKSTKLSKKRQYKSKSKSKGLNKNSNKLSKKRQYKSRSKSKYKSKSTKRLNKNSNKSLRKRNKMTKKKKRNMMGGAPRAVGPRHAVQKEAPNAPKINKGARGMKNTTYPVRGHMKLGAKLGSEMALDTPRPVTARATLREGRGGVRGELSKIVQKAELAEQVREWQVGQAAAAERVAAEEAEQQERERQEALVERVKELRLEEERLRVLFSHNEADVNIANAITDIQDEIDAIVLPSNTTRVSMSCSPTPPECPPGFTCNTDVCERVQEFMRFPYE